MKLKLVSAKSEDGSAATASKGGLAQSIQIKSRRAILGGFSPFAFKSDRGRFRTSGFVLISFIENVSAPRLGDLHWTEGGKLSCSPSSLRYDAPMHPSRTISRFRPITGLQSPASQDESAGPREWFSRDQCRLRVRMPWLGVYRQARCLLDGRLIGSRQRSTSAASATWKQKVQARRRDPRSSTRH
jgi:hypothetical protein